MKKRFTAAALVLTLVLGVFTSASAIGLETTNFSKEELDAISQSNQIIAQEVQRDSVTRAGSSRELPMTVIKQANDYYCGPATACMVAATLGLGTYSQSTMASKIGTTSAGSSSSQIVSAMNNLLSGAGKSGRYQLTNLAYSNFQDSVIASISAGFPVILNVKKMPKYTVSVGHFLAVNGYTIGWSGTQNYQHLYICDPHPKYSGSYMYTIAEMEHACESAAGNFIRKQ